MDKFNITGINIEFYILKNIGNINAYTKYKEENCMRKKAISSNSSKGLHVKNFYQLISFMLTFVMILSVALPVNANHEPEKSKAADSNMIEINPTMTDKDFSIPGSVVSGSAVTVDNTFIGKISYDGTKNNVTLDGGCLNLKAISAVCNSYKSGITMPKEMGIYTKVKFNNVISERNLFQIRKGISGTAAYQTLLKFKKDGTITDVADTNIGTYSADTWYEITAYVDFTDNVYKLWMNGNLVVDNVAINSGFDGVGMLHKLEQRNTDANVESTMSIASFKAGTIVKPQIPFNDFIKGTLTNKDFMKDTLAETTAVRRTIDTTFLGYCDFKDGENSIEIVDMPVSDSVKKALKFNAGSKRINTYKGAVKQSGKWGIELKTKFNNTSSERTIFEFKNTVPNGKFTNLLKFDKNGKILDCNNTEIGTYNADEWYVIQIIIDTDKKSYGVWVNDNMLNSDIGISDPLWDGTTFNTKLIQDTSSAIPKDDITYIAYIKAGEIVPKAGNITVDDITLRQKEGCVVQAKADVEGAFIGRQVCASSDTSVVKTYENGLLAVGQGTAAITLNVPDTGQSTTFEVTVTDNTMWETNANINDDVLLSVLASGLRADVTSKTELQLLSDYPKVSEYMALSEVDFINKIKDASSAISTRYKQTEFQNLTRIMIAIYRLDKVKNVEYAKRAALILYYQAKDYPRIAPLTGGSSFKGSDEVFPSSAVYTYGILMKDNLIVNQKTIWEYVADSDKSNDAALTGEIVKEVIEELWFRPAAFASVEFIFTKPAELFGGVMQQLNNIDVYGARSVAATANLINDPDLIRYVVLFYDKLLSGGYWSYDGMWFEGSSQYSDQVTGNVQLGVKAISDYRDPAGYTWSDSKKYEAEYDQKFGLEATDCRISELIFDNSINADFFRTRWPLNKLSENIAGSKMVYPNGKPIPVNDSYSLADFDNPLSNVLPDKLSNIEFPGFGYYGLVQGDASNATHIGLMNQSKLIGFSGGHTHTSFLTMSLWSAGADLLSDIGYVVAGNGNYEDGNKHTRFPAMKPRFHNMPWVWMEDKSNITSTAEWTKPAVLAYDDGSSNGNKIEVVELEKGAAGKTKRLNMLVQLDSNRNYVLDLSRLTGGDGHEIYLRGSDTENMDVTVNDITFTDTGEANLKDYLTKQGKTEGFDIDREYMQKPQAANGNEDFSMKWTGNKSGSAVTTWINGVENSDMYLSELPRSREVASKEEELTKTAPHLSRFRLTDKTADFTTQYGAIYEPTKSDQSNLIQDVKWTTSPDGKYIVAEVTTDGFKDIIYISDDDVKRKIEGIEFSGSIAVVRINTTSKKNEFTYVYGDSSADAAVGEQGRYKVLQTSTKSVNSAIDPDFTKTNTITVEGIVPNMGSYVGKWIAVSFGDNSSVGLKVQSIAADENNTKITVEQYMPFKLTETGVKTTFFPIETINGDAHVILTTSKFNKASTNEDNNSGGSSGSGGSSLPKEEIDSDDKEETKPESKPSTIKYPKVTESAYNSVEISWKKPKGSEGYEIYRATSGKGPFKKIAVIANPEEREYKDKNLTTGKTYYYKIKGYKMVDGKKILSDGGSVIKVTPSLKKTAAKGKRNSATSATVSWKKVSGAGGYEIYRSTSKSEKYKKAGTVSKASVTSFKNSKLQKSKPYYYKVRAYRIVNKKKVYSVFSVPIVVK